MVGNGWVKRSILLSLSKMKVRLLESDSYLNKLLEAAFAFYLNLMCQWHMYTLMSTEKCSESPAGCCLCVVLLTCMRPSHFYSWLYSRKLSDKYDFFHHISPTSIFEILITVLKSNGVMHLCSVYATAHNINKYNCTASQDSFLGNHVTVPTIAMETGVFALILCCLSLSLSYLRKCARIFPFLWAGFTF